MSWNSLPPELRRPILQIFAANNSPLARYAAINREWQSAIEAETFRSLTITLDSIFEFTEHFSEQTRRQCSLKHIRLSIGIPSPEPPPLNWIVTFQPVGTSADFSKAVSLLFAFFEEWDAPAILQKPDGGVRLEISLPFGPSDTVGGQEVDEIQLTSGFTYFSGTKDAGRMSGGGLPVVRVITEFIFLDSNRCTISPKTMFDIIMSLPNLTQVYFERSFRLDDITDQTNQSELARFLPMWPDSIKRIVIVQKDINLLGNGNGNGDRPEIARFAAIVASHSFKLEELAVCHYIEASDFFEEAQRLQTLHPRPWNNLLSLALTFDGLSRNLRFTWSDGENTQGYGQPDRRLNSLFQKAGEAAKLMPVLRTMQLLNCDYAFSSIFKYEAANGNATVRWAYTWPFQLSDSVRQVWGEVAQQNNFELQISSEKIDKMILCDSVFYSFSSRD